jgi:hypothetical protein
MTCDVARNRLLALPDPTRPTDDLLPHLAVCASCRAAQAAAMRLDALLTRLPVPTAERRKADFLAGLETDGPVIRSRPVLPSTLAESGAFRPVANWLKRIEWRYVGGGVAAAVAVGLGLFFLLPKAKGPTPEQAERPRSERLARMVKRTNELATTARAPHQQVSVFAGWTDDLKGEACEVAKVADQETMNALARDYEKLVAEGVVRQARQMQDRTPAPELRRQALSDALRTLAAAEADARQLAENAPPNAKAALDRIARSAQEGRASLAEIAAQGTPN